MAVPSANNSDILFGPVSFIIEPLHDAVPRLPIHHSFLAGALPTGEQPRTGERRGIVIEPPQIRHRAIKFAKVAQASLVAPLNGRLRNIMSSQANSFQDAPSPSADLLSTSIPNEKHSHSCVSLQS